MSSDETEIEKCPKCGKILELCRCSTVTIEHKMPKGEGSQTELEKTKDELEERNAQLATLALKEFDEEKEKLLKSISDPDKRKKVDEMIGDSPERMENVKLVTGLLSEALGYGNIKIESEDESETSDGREKLPAKGKVGLPPKGYDNPQATKNERVLRHIDRQYEILADPSKSQEEKMRANAEITSMLGEAIRGFRQSGRIMRINVMQCPKCGSVMEHDNCATCGFEIPRNQK